LVLAALLVWIAITVWVYKDAEKRGMSGALWALVVFFAHLIGLLVYFLIRTDHPVFVKEDGSPAPACPKCGKTAGRDHAFCPSCGEQLQPGCPKCKKSVQPDWKACPYCGQKL
jgi:RNA polymerase subunit RPABC4/transcription elongation factor Spt4